MAKQNTHIKPTTPRKQKILALIPARGGSKRLIGKNTKLLDGKPLIEWTIDGALASEFTHVVVSTESNEIAHIAKECGAEVPFMRSDSLAEDDSRVVDVVIEALEFYKKQGEQFDGVMLLQPTSPFRTTHTIQTALDLFSTSQGESVVSVSPASSHPSWCKTINDGVLRPYSADKQDKTDQRAQQLSPVFQLNGLIYLTGAKTILNKRSFYSENTIALIIESEEECIDIDTPFDWLVAEAIVCRRELSV